MTKKAVLRATREEIITQLGNEADALMAEHGLTADTTDAEMARAASPAGRWLAMGSIRAKLEAVRLLRVGVEPQQGPRAPEPIPEDAPEFVDSRTAARYLGRALATLAQWSTRGSGQIAPFKSGRKVLWRVADIRDAVANRAPERKVPQKEVMPAANANMLRQITCAPVPVTSSLVTDRRQVIESLIAAGLATRVVIAGETCICVTEAGEAEASASSRLA